MLEEEQRHRIDRPAQVELAHVRLVKRHIRKPLPSELEHRRRRVHSFDLAPATKLLQVPAGVARHVEEGGRARRVGLDEAVYPFGEIPVVVRAMDQVVQLCRLVRPWLDLGHPTM